MLALTDSALARLAIAATAVPPQERERWLREIADRVDPPIPTIGTHATIAARSPAARRQARVRARRKNGVHMYRLPLRDVYVEGLIDMMVTSGQLTEREALDHQRVEAELARLLEEQGQRWSR